MMMILEEKDSYSECFDTIESRERFLFISTGIIFSAYAIQGSQIFLINKLFVNFVVFLVVHY